MAGNDVLIGQALEAGRLFTEEILASDEVMSLEEIAAQLGITVDEVLQATGSHVLLAIGPPERRRYPRWQIIQGKPMPRLQDIFRWLDNEMTVFLFLRESLELLGSRTPIEAVTEGEIDEVVSIAEAICMGEYI